MVFGNPTAESSFPVSQLFAGENCGEEIDELPDLLYHYTDATAMMGIVAPGAWPVDYPESAKVYQHAAKLWASDSRYMNDQLELRFGADIFCRHLREAAKTPEVDDNLGNAFSAVAEAFETQPVYDWGFRCFAASFSAERDLLSQWRGYGGGTGGFAIGFTWDALAGHTYAFHPQSTAMGTTPFRTELRKVGYGEAEAERRAEGFVSSTVDRWNSTGAQTVIRRGDRPHELFLAGELFREVATIKHEAFAEEQEWRLWAISEARYPVNVRPGRSGLVPYLEVGVNLRMGGQCVHPTIGEIVVGPHPDKSGQVAATREFLKSQQHDPQLVTASNVPFRG
ncbi:DUF2971 domain-containing protein [Gordonia tangerina]|uniref:DUF2971 domain-containing protein n=1 Tax=Gordonia tangerina TaxID=2911060 RepID=A0ABS9DN42_9ACTN|nr:DUF2971 domain-containing protein [Gordonia tangerina]MCF3940639.1 DUF2971 domain-containing protein [Gordonia tangerina]